MTYIRILFEFLIYQFKSLFTPSKDFDPKKAGAILVRPIKGLFGFIIFMIKESMPLILISMILLAVQYGLWMKLDNFEDYIALIFGTVIILSFVGTEAESPHLFIFILGLILSSLIISFTTNDITENGKVTITKDVKIHKISHKGVYDHVPDCKGQDFTYEYIERKVPVVNLTLKSMNVKCADPVDLTGILEVE